MPLFCKDGSSVREIKRLFAKDGSTVRTIRKLWVRDGNDVRQIFSAATTWLLAGAAQVFSTGNKEVIDLGIQDSFNAGGAKETVSLGASNDFDAGGQNEEVEIGVHSQFYGGGSSSPSTADYIDYRWTSGSFYNVVSSNMQSFAVRMRHNSLALTVDVNIGGNNLTRTTFSNYEQMIDFLVDLVNEDTNQSRIFGSAERIGTDTLRLIIRDGIDVTGGFNQGSNQDNPINIGLYFEFYSNRNDVQRDTVVAFSSTAFSATPSSNLFSFDVNNADSWNFVPTTGTNLNNSSNIRFEGINPASTFSISNTGDSIPEVTGTFAFGANASSARSSIKSALAADTEFTSKWDFVSDQTLAANAGSWDIKFNSIPSVTFNDGNTYNATVYLPVNGESIHIAAQWDAGISIETFVNRIVSSSNTGGGGNISDFTRTKIGTDTVRITRPAGRIKAENTATALAISGDIVNPAFRITGFGDSSTNTGSFDVTITDVNDNTVTKSGVSGSSTVYILQFEDEDDNVSGNDPYTVARYRAKTAGNKGDFSITLTPGIDYDEADDYPTDFESYFDESTEYAAPASAVLSSDLFDDITINFAMGDDRIAARNAIRSALEGTAGWTDEYDFLSTGTGSLNGVSSTVVRFQAEETGARNDNVALTLTGGNAGTLQVQSTTEGADSATYSISSFDDSIPAITGAFAEGATASEAIAELKTALSQDTEFSALWDFTSNQGPANNTAARYTSVVNANRGDISFSIVQNDGSNTTPYNEVVTQGVADTLATVITVTDPSVNLTVTTAVGTDVDSIGEALAGLSADIIYDAATNTLEAGPDATIVIDNPNTLTITEQ